MKIKLIGLFISLMLLFPFANADQNDEQLNTLFELLNNTQSSYEGSEITRQIWHRWLDSNDEEVVSLLQTGILFLAESRLEKALQIFTEVTEIAPDFAEGWNKRATVYYLMGRFESSTKDVDRTLALEPRHFGALAGQGLIDLKTGDHVAAMTHFKKALELNPFLTQVKAHIHSLERELRKNMV